MKQIYANNFTTLELGRKGENLARQVVFDVRDLESLYGPGDVEVIYQRPGDAQPYPLAVQMDGTLVTWDVTATDTEMSNAYGKCELRYYVGETLAKSKIWRTWVEPALPTPSETAPPEPEQGWVEQVLATGVAAQQAADAAKADADRAATLAAEVAVNAAQTAQDASKAAKAMDAAQTAQRLAAEAQGAAEAARTAAAEAQAAAEKAATDAAGAKQDAETAQKAAQDAEAAAAGSASAAANSAASASAAASAAQQSARSAAESAAVYDDVVADVNQLKQDVAAITPDDTTVDGKPWTSKKIVDTICQPFEESGNPVQFYPVENYPLGVKVSWEPTQEGEGDPSPDNIRPITGRDSVTITHSNDIVSNDYNIALPETVYGGTLDVETGVVTVEWIEKVTQLGDTSLLSPVGNGFVRKNLPPTANAILGKSNQKCNIAPYSYNYTGELTHFYIDTNGYAMIILPVDTPAETVIQTVCKVSVPYTIQLTPQQITALYGVNTIYTDANGVVVTGAEDQKHTITELKNAIISLGGNI